MMPHISECKVPRHSLQSVSTHALHVSFLLGSLDPVFDDGRTLDGGVDFANQGGAEEDHKAVFDGLDKYPLSGQGFTDPPAFSMEIDGSLAVDLEGP